MDSSIDAAVAAGSTKPAWALTCFAIGMLGIAISAIPVFFTSVKTPTARRLHWGGGLCAAVFLGIAVSVHGWVPIVGFWLALLAFMAFIAGTDDSSRALAPAQGQRTQAIAAVIGLLPVFAIPAIGYLIGFRVGRNRPTAAD